MTRNSFSNSGDSGGNGAHAGPSTLIITGEYLVPEHQCRLP